MKSRVELLELKQKILTKLNDTNDVKLIEKLNEMYINIIFLLYEIEHLN